LARSSEITILGMQHTCAVPVGARVDARRGLLRSRGTHKVGRTSAGQENSETCGTRGSDANAAKRYAAFVFLDNSFANPQSQARAFCRLRAKERLKELAGVLGLDANACVDNRNGDTAALELPVIPFADGDSKISTSRHCLDRVANEVQEYLPQFNGESVNDSRNDISFAQTYVAHLELPFLQSEDIVEQLGKHHGDGSL